MGIISNISSIFTNGATVNAIQSPAATQQATPGNIPVNQSPMLGNNGVVPANTTMEPVKKEVESPMSGFKDLWHPDPNAKPEVKEPIFNIDQSKLQAAVKNNDFSKAVPAEVLARISAGGEDAVKATMEAMNSMAQSGLAQNTTLTAKMIEQALEKQQQQFMEKLPSIIKNQNSFDNLRNTNPILQNPATAPIMEAVLAQIQRKFPNSSAEDQQKQAELYVNQFADVAKAPELAAKANTGKQTETDWNEFLTDSNS